MEGERWIRRKGDFLAFGYPCFLTRVIVCPDANQDYADVYDGRDTTAGTKLARFKSATRTTREFSFGDGVLMDGGIYVDAFDDAVETTIFFIPRIEPPAPETP